MTREGIPVRCWCWPGNTNDNSILPEVKDGLRGWRLGRVVTVVDRGFSSDANLAYLRRAGGHWIAGERMRDGSARRPGRAGPPGPLPERAGQPAGQGSPPRRRRPGSGGSCATTPLEAERDKAHRDAALARLEAELERIRTARERDAKKRQDRADARVDPQADAPGRAECALRDHPALGPLAAADRPPVGCVIDRAKVAAEERLDGKYLLSTSDPDLSAEDVALGYKNLLEAERGFRDLKSTLELRPVFHRLEPRIRAHVLLCWLALLLSASPNDAPARPGGGSPPSWAGCTPSPSRARRHRRADHRPHRRPDRHSWRLRRAAPAPRHPPPPRLTRPNTPHACLSTRGHTRSSTDPARSRRSHPRSGPSVCLPTAEPGVDPEVSGHLRDRLPVCTDDPNSPLTELRVVLPTCLWHHHSS